MMHTVCLEFVILHTNARLVWGKAKANRHVYVLCSTEVTSDVPCAAIALALLLHVATCRLASRHIRSSTANRQGKRTETHAIRGHMTSTGSASWSGAD